jgi:lysine-specific demethylase 3
MKKRTVVPCTKCKQKMYCIPCIKQWWGILYTFNFFFVKMSLYSKKPIFNHIILAEFCVYRYPRLKEEEISELCPFCRGNCNCNACLHSNGMIKVWLLSYWTVNAFKLLPLKKQPDFFFVCVCLSNLQTSKRVISDGAKIQNLQHLLYSLRPYLKQICEEQTREIEIEATIQSKYGFQL